MRTVRAVRRDLGLGDAIFGRGLVVAAIVTLGSATLLVVAGLAWELSLLRTTVVSEAPPVAVTQLAAQRPRAQSTSPVTVAEGTIVGPPEPAPAPSPDASPLPPPMPSPVVIVRSEFGPSGARRPSAELPIVMFHYIGPLPPNPDVFRKDLTTSSSLFEGVLQYLVGQQATSVSLDDLLAHYAGGPELPKRAVILTFDDGYEDAYTEAFPLLRKYGMVGTFYVITDFVGRPGYLTWDEIAEMDAAGMTIGAHSLTHPDFTVIGPAELRRQLVEPKRALEEHLGHPVTHLAYPSGKYNAATVAASRAAGYATAVTVIHGLIHPATTPFELTRVRAHGADTAAALGARLTPASWRR
jgi:peptidoglycan/xylan/chitin deacetylase (PgdA/CDA1 family)